MEREFDFEEGDLVLIRVREQGKLTLKAIAECSNIEHPPNDHLSPKATFDISTGTMNWISFRPYEAEFEVIDDPDEVSF